MKIWIVDAFASEKFSGNPAAVCILEEFLDIALMQNIATEMNLSETAFVKKLSDNTYHIRWFTPVSEAPLCGHATIAAMHVLVQNGLVQIDQKIKFNSLSGELYAEKNGEWIELNFPNYASEPLVFTEELLRIVSENPVYTGLAENCLIMEFSEPKQVINLNPDLKLLMQLPYRALIVTSVGRQEGFMCYDFISRYFAPKVGIFEDPVCASAHCRLVPYWSNRLNRNEFIAYQASKRGGIIKCKNLIDRVAIAGKAITVVSGILHI